MASGLGFEWDEIKAASNRAAHGVPFETARRFDFERAEIMVDDRRAYGEIRMVAVGEIDGRVHVLVHGAQGPNSGDLAAQGKPKGD